MDNTNLIHDKRGEINASLIISVYKNTKFLYAVLESLRHQTEQSFEILISEDGCSAEMRNFISQYPFLHRTLHLTQDDLGWRKNRALNRAVLTAGAEHLIFIDGDCVLHPKFIEMHTRNFKENRILAGKRVLLDERLSDMIVAKPDKAQTLQKEVWFSLIGGVEKACAGRKKAFMPRS